MFHKIKRKMNDLHSGIGLSAAVNVSGVWASLLHLFLIIMNFQEFALSSKFQFIICFSNSIRKFYISKVPMFNVQRVPYIAMRYALNNNNHIIHKRCV